MSKVWLEVAEDRSRPEGGHAVIKLHGVMRLSQNPTFTIDPIDGDSKSGVARINGAHAPLATRETAEGVELIVGPDVVENPALLPGTPVAIEVPAAGVRAEVLWPNITPMVQRRRQQVVMSTARRLSLVQANRDLGRGTGDLADPARRVVNGGAVNGETVVEAIAGLKVVPARVIPPAGAEARPPLAVAPAPAAAVAVAALSPERQASREVDGAGVAMGVAAVGNATRDSAPIIVTPLAPVAKPQGSDPQRSAPEPRPQSAGLPADRYAALEPDRLGRRLSGIAMMMALMAVGCSLLVLQMLRSMRSARETAPIAAVASVVTPGPAAAGAMLAAPPSALFDVFRVGPVSPKGTKSADVDLTKALSLADTYIHSAGTARDLREGQYWLQRALALSLGDERSRWALTQLGSLYAAPADGDPSYEKARLMWEVSAALGDPVAMCFLGNLHQFGLGVPTSRRAALRWYELAAASGGCRGVDELIAHVKR